MSYTIEILTLLGVALSAYLVGSAQKAREEALSHLREATDAYRDARHERQEAHRILRLTLGVAGGDPEAEDASEAPKHSP